MNVTLRTPDGQTRTTVATDPALDFTLGDVPALDPDPRPAQTTKADRHNELLSAALAYAERGLYVIPLHEPLFDSDGKCCGCSCEANKRSKNYERWLKAKQAEGKCRHLKYDPNYKCRTPGKHPRLSDWETNASKDPAQIRQWWNKWSTANIGIAAGKSGLITFDRDTYKTIYDDDSDLFTQADKETATQISQNGGEHLVYRMPEGAHYTNANNTLPPGVDIRGDGGMFVAEPSIGPTGNQWHWEEGYSILEVEPRPLPAGLKAILDAAHEKSVKAHAVTFTTPTTEKPDLIRWPLSKAVLELIHNPTPVGQRSEADMKVVAALAYAGATDDEILGVFQHNSIGTAGKFADANMGVRYLTLTIGKARSWVEAHPRPDVGATIANLRLWIKTNSFALFITPQFLASDGTYRTELTDRKVADACLDLMESSGRLSVNAGKKLLGKLAGVSCNTAYKALARLGWLFTIEPNERGVRISLTDQSRLHYIDPLNTPPPVNIRDQSSKNDSNNVFSPHKSDEAFLSGLSKFMRRRIHDVALALDITPGQAKIDYTLPALGAGVLLAYDTSLRIGAMTAQEYATEAGMKLSAARNHLRRAEMMGLAESYREGPRGPKIYIFTPEFWRRIDELLPNMRTYTTGSQRENKRLESAQIWAQRGMAKATDPDQQVRLERRFAKLARQRLPHLASLYVDKGLSQDEIIRLAYEVDDYKRSLDTAATIRTERNARREEHREDVQMIRELAEAITDVGTPLEAVFAEIMKYGVFDPRLVRNVLQSPVQMRNYESLDDVRKRLPKPTKVQPKLYIPNLVI